MDNKSKSYSAAYVVLTSHNKNQAITL